MTSFEQNLAKRDMISEMKQLNPEGDILFTALGKLQNPSEIELFIKQFIDTPILRKRETGLGFSPEQIIEQDKEQNERLIKTVEDSINRIKDEPKKVLWQSVFNKVKFD